MSEETPRAEGLDWYARPAASSPSERPEEEDQEPVYYSASLIKLSVMCLCTLGLYQYFWFYENWQLELTPRHARKRLVFRPAFRSFLAGFYCYSLFKRIGVVGRGANAAHLHAGAIAIAWIALQVAQRLPDPFGLITYASFVPLLVVQRVVNEINASEDPPILPRGEFSVWDLLACAVGLSLIVLALAGTFGLQLFPDLELDM